MAFNGFFDDGSDYSNMGNYSAKPKLNMPQVYDNGNNEPTMYGAMNFDMNGVNSELGGGGEGWLSGLTDMFKSDGLFNSDTLKGFGSIAGGIGGIMNAMNASDQLDMAEDMYGFQMDFANRNLGNQAQVLNNKIIGDEQRYLQDLKGSDDDAASYAKLQAQGKQNAQGKTVDGSPV